MNPSEQGQPAWTAPTGPDVSVVVQQQPPCPLFQNPLFWLVAVGLVIYFMTQSESKESEID